MSSETGKRNADRLNMMGVVLAGICGSVLVYVSIALLQAFYMNDTAQVETMADYGGQDTMHRSIKSEQILAIDPVQGRKNAGTETFVIKIDRAMELVVDGAKQKPGTKGGPSNLAGPGGWSNDHSKVEPAYGRPKLIPAPGAGAGSGSGAAPGAGSGSASDPGVIAPAPGGAPPAAPPAGAGAGSGSAGGHAP